MWENWKSEVECKKYDWLANFIYINQYVLTSTVLDEDKATL